MERLVIALAGNPNCGKTTLFNNLTGANQRVGNYSGVTVEKRQGCRCYGAIQYDIIDLPGTYSLSAKAEDERVARQFLLDESPDLIVNVVDAGNLERNLYLTLQLAELGRPMLLVLNMVDMAERQGVVIHDKKIAKLLGVPVVRTVGSKARGTDELLDAMSVMKLEQFTPVEVVVDYGPAVEPILAEVQRRLELVAYDQTRSARWQAIKLLEGDAEVEAYFAARKGGEAVVKLAAERRGQLEEKLDEEVDIYFAERRYQVVREWAEQITSKGEATAPDFSERIDRVLTNRLFGLPIFLFLMWLLFNGVFTLGAYPQEWLEAGFAWVGDAARSVIPEGELRDLVADGIIGGVGGVLVFLPNILLLFLGIAILEGTGYMARAAFLMDRIMRAVGLHGKSFIPLLLGFGCTVPSVLGTRTLESPRDRLVTMLVAPLMSCSAKLPVYTLLIGSFFSDEWAGTVLFIVYFIGIFLAVVMAKVFRSHLLPGDSEPFVMEMPPYHWPTAKSLVLQMWQRAGLYLRKAGTIILAASILVWFLTNRPVDVQFSQPYDELIAARQQQVLAAPEDERAALEEAVIQLQRDQQGEKLAQSYASRIGKAVEPLVKPLGFDWKIAVSLLAAVSAKEVFVSTMATIYSVESSEESLDALRAALVADQTLTPLVAVSLMMFVLIYTPCVATLAAIRRETNSWRWPLFSAVYSVALAWVVAFLVAQIGRWLGL